MTLPAQVAANHEARVASFESVLRVSLFRRLNENLRAAASAGAAEALRRVRSALRAARIEDALRIVDQAWRRLPDVASTLAPIYASLLILEARNDDAALRLLRLAIEFTPDAEVDALIALALLRLQRPEDARLQLQRTLADYCVVPGGLLFRIAGEFMRQPAVEFPGWVGRGPALELVGELAAHETSNALDIRLDGQAGFAQLLRGTPRDDIRAFSLRSSQARIATSLEVSIRGMPLLGSGVRTPSDFALDGRIRGVGRRLTGWVRLGWRPDQPLRLRIEDKNGDRSPVRTLRRAQPAWHWPFQIDLRASGIRGHRMHLLAQLPDGRWQPLPGSPLLLEPAVRLAGRRSARLPKWRTRLSRSRLQRALSQDLRQTDVIIPVFRGREETLACIKSVWSTIDSTARIVVVDDATEDTALASALDALAGEGRITLLRNPQNLGFVASVTRAMALHATHDVVLLNSDTLVFDDWLARLRAAAYSDSTVGTVTPLTNSGSITSYPGARGAAFGPEDGAALQALAAATHSGARIAIPVGVGFCLYMRRDCLLDVGSFDLAAFGRGYGEETDFCLRARSRGWSNMLAADVFVYHAGGVSFGSRRAALLDRSQRLINLRHPGYDAFIASFAAQDPLQLLWRRLDERRLFAFQGRFVLFVTLSLAGGVDRFVAERCRHVRTQGLFPLVLRAAQTGDAYRCELWTDAIDVPNLRYNTPAEVPALIALLAGLDLDAIEIQHFLHLDASVIDAVRALPVPYDVFVHDYAWICPRVTLIDGSGRYCGEPAVTVCQSCVRRHGSNLGENISVTALRARSAAWLGGARRVIAPSADTASRLRRHFRDLDVQVQPHRAPVVPAPLPLRSASAVAFRVALIGAIGEHKGYRILLKCARDALARSLPLQFIVIGYTQNDAALLKTGKVFITGRYTEAEAPHLLRREHPDVAWLPSVWPETWCYTLDHALGAGLPVAAFDLGAIAERLRATETGTLMPIDLAPPQINDRLLQLARGRRLPQPDASHSVQTSLSRAGDQANMATTKRRESSMNKTSDGKPTQDVQEEGLSASVQVLPLPPGLYLFSVKAASPVIAKATGPLSLPAVHVGLGPGVRTEQVEFIAGPSTHGAWLFAQGDLLVTKINGVGATLIMTSMRAPGGEVLSIKVERLEARAAENDAARPAAAPPPSAPRAAHKGREAVPVKQPAKPVIGAVAADLPAPLQIGAHIRTRGDMNFADLPWAGRVAPGLWIESFSIRPLKGFAAHDIEYKGLTASGFETPWLSDDKMCGTKGMAVPLVGFAVRFKPSPASAGYDCEYSGYYQSGLTVGPLRNGAPCRSTVANDPLEGIQLRLVRRSIASPLPVAAPVKSVLPPLKSRQKAAKTATSFHTRKANGAGKGALAKRKGSMRAAVKYAKARTRAVVPRRLSTRSTRRAASRRP